MAISWAKISEPDQTPAWIRRDLYVVMYQSHDESVGNLSCAAGRAKLRHEVQFHVADIDGRDCRLVHPGRTCLRPESTR